MVDMNRPGRGANRDAGQGGLSFGNDDASQKTTAKASTQDRRADAVAGIELLAELVPPVFRLHGSPRRPLKIGIEIDIIRAVRGAMTPREVTDAVRLYTNSAAYLRRLRRGAVRIDLAGNPAGFVTEQEEARATETLARRLLKAADRKDARTAATISEGSTAIGK
jgi:ProP effector